jgi:hypothetical protein
MNKISEANKEVHDGIANFEETLRKNGIEPKVNKD